MTSVETGPRRVDDTGSAMILVLMVLVLLTALGATLSAVTLSNLQGSRRATEAAEVLGAAEAGVAQAVTFIRQNGVAGLTCRNAGTEAAPSWVGGCGAAYGRSSPVGPPSWTAGDARYAVWVEEEVHFRPNSGVQGVYLVHSVGYLDGTPPPTCHGVDGACRSVTASVVVNDFALGSGLYTKSIGGNSAGGAKIEGQSLFTLGCVPKRGSLDVSGFDRAHGIPAGVHSTGLITDAPVSKCGDPSRAIHDGGACSTEFPFDQDSEGGALSTTSSCWTALRTATVAALGAGSVPDPAVYGPRQSSGDGVYGSAIDSQAAMQEQFGLKYPPISDIQLERLEEMAREDGTWTDTTTWPSVAGSRGIFFFDLTARPANQAVVNLNGIPAPYNDVSGACRNGLVIVKNGSAQALNKHASTSASVFLLSPGGGRGVIKVNGGTYYGGLFAEEIDFGGNPVFRAATCPEDSVNPALLTVTMTSYSEDD